MMTTQLGTDPQVDAQVLAAVTAAIQSVQADTGYGSIEITIHDGRVKQIERREKVRFDPSKAKTK